MAAALLPDPLWDLVEPFLPTPLRRPKGGRHRVSDRACLTGILFDLRSGIPWQMLPQELGSRCSDPNLQPSPAATMLPRETAPRRGSVHRSEWCGSRARAD